ncbi:hypothetical protein LCGC14_1184100 [marine sediment metagenome]|uniref:Uncharacterized protein n=1 Tax=marine sediment metagenome TaxID=412755 RepID=A0A0F9P467_9ZZZZ
MPRKVTNNAQGIPNNQSNQIVTYDNLRHPL